MCVSSAGVCNYNLRRILAWMTAGFICSLDDRFSILYVVFDSATRTIAAQHGRIFFVRLTLEEALFFSIFKSRLLFFCV